MYKPTATNKMGFSFSNNLLSIRGTDRNFRARYKNNFLERILVLYIYDTLKNSIFVQNKIFNIMTWRGFFEGIGDLFVNVLFTPLDALRELELTSWFLANGVNWLFMLIGFVAMVYWLMQVKKYNDEGTEDRTSTSHSYLGKTQ